MDLPFKLEYQNRSEKEAREPSPWIFLIFILAAILLFAGGLAWLQYSSISVD
jgi:hypothetical protein